MHTRENNHESQAHLEANRGKFSRQCEKVLELLKRGERLTVRSAIVDHSILSLPRRIMDLKKSGIDIEWIWLTDENGKRVCKEWFIPKTPEIGVFEKQGRLWQ